MDVVVCLWYMLASPYRCYYGRYSNRLALRGQTWGFASVYKTSAEPYKPLAWITCVLLLSKRLTAHLRECASVTITTVQPSQPPVLISYSLIFRKQVKKSGATATKDDSPFLLRSLPHSGNSRFFLSLSWFSSNWRRRRVINVFRPAHELPLPTRFIIRIVCLEAAFFIQRRWLALKGRFSLSSLFSIQQIQMHFYNQQPPPQLWNLAHL